MSILELFYRLRRFKAQSQPLVTMKSPMHDFGPLSFSGQSTKLKIPVMKDALWSTVSNFHTTDIILANNSKFSFVGSIPNAMFIDVPTASKILEGFRKLAPFGFCTITPELQAILAEADKTKKVGQKGKKKGEKKKRAQEGPSAQAQTPTKRKRQASSS